MHAYGFGCKWQAFYEICMRYYVKYIDQYVGVRVQVCVKGLALEESHIWLLLIYAKNSTHFNAKQHTYKCTCSNNTHTHTYTCRYICIAVCKADTLPVAKLCLFHAVRVLFLRKITFLHQTLTHPCISICVCEMFKENVNGNDDDTRMIMFGTCQLSNWAGATSMWAPVNSEYWKICPQYNNELYILI